MKEVRRTVGLIVLRGLEVITVTPVEKGDDYICYVHKKQSKKEKEEAAKHGAKKAEKKQAVAKASAPGRKGRRSNNSSETIVRVSYGGFGGVVVSRLRETRR